MISVTSIFGIVLLPLMLAFPWIMKKMGTMSKMVGVFACIGIAGYVLIFFSGAFLSGVLVGNILGSFAGYISTEGVVEQPASALMMIRIDYAIIPAVLMVIIAVCAFTFVKLEKKVPEWEAKQKAKADGEAAEA